ncbi:MAG: four helix bundle protein [Phycisphaerae bacterium]
MGEFGREICERTRRLGVEVIRMAGRMPKNPAGWEIARQVVRSSNSVAANLEEAQGAVSDADFAHSVNIARKEARETHMWLRNIRDSGLMAGPELEAMIQESNEVVGILVATMKTLQRRQQTKKRRNC